MTTSPRHENSSSHRDRGTRALTTHQKIMMGGLGALTPIALNLLAVDLKTTFATISVFVLLGYTLRVVILFYLGGLVAFLHRDENKPIKLFELGIVAPALLTTLLSAAGVESHKATNAPDPGQPTASLFFFMPVVYAQTDPTVKLRGFTLPEQSTSQQIWRGLTGSKMVNVWFVIAGYYSRLDDAQRAAEQINRQQTDFKAEVFAPYGQTHDYPVVIGANLTFDDANALKRKAANDRVNADLWTFPEK
jgi:hypothetical protein